MRGVPADKSAAMMAPKQKVEKPMRIMGRLFGYILRRYKLHCLGVLLFIPLTSVCYTFLREQVHKRLGERAASGS